MSLHIPRHIYVEHYGPTVGDRVRLGDTELIIEVERDYTVYGDEVKFGGGKVIRDGMGRSPEATSAQGVPDLVITNALIVDYWGIVKADVAIKGGKIAGIGKAGSRNLMDGVTPVWRSGPAPKSWREKGFILTAGGIDAHIHFISPQQIDDGPLQRHYHHDRRWHWSSHRHQRDDLHAGALEHRTHVRGGRSLSAEFRLSGERQCLMP